MHDVFETEDESDRHRGLLPKGEHRQPGPHIADIAVSSRQPLHGGFRDIAGYQQ
jgi:hypothetical protein